MVEKFKPLTQAQKNKLRRKAVEALHDENYGDDGDGFQEHATAQAVIALMDENAALKTEVRKLKSAGNKLDVTPAVSDSPCGWISTSEGMPDKADPRRVLAFTPNERPDMRYRLVSADMFKSVCRDATHWQYVNAPAGEAPGERG